MLKRWRESIILALNKPLFGTRVIPIDATVESAEFPEDEFPTWCERCGYLLRGIADGNCPECGTPFARGRLLVTQYVIRFGRASWKGSPAAKWAWALFVIGATMYAIPAVAAILLILFVKMQQPPQVWLTVDFMVKVMGTAHRFLLLTGLLLILLSGALAITQVRRCASQRRALLLAIFANADRVSHARKGLDVDTSS